MTLADIDGLAGFAALVNGALLWPIVRALKAVTKDHGDRLTKLEARPAKRPTKKTKKGRWA